MLRRWNRHLLMNTTTGGEGGAGAAGGNAGGTGTGTGGAGTGGSSAGALFDDNGAAGGAGGGQGGGTGAAGGGSGGAGAGAAGGTGVVIPENWKDSLPDDLKALPMLGKYKTPADVIKAYAHLEKHLGDKMVAPQRGTPLAQMKEYFQKLGLPADAKDYVVDPVHKDKVDPEFLKGFTEQAYGMNLLPEQAKGLVDWFAQVNDAARQQQVNQYQTQVKQGLDNLKTEWGDEGYKKNLGLAKAALSEFFDAEGVKYIRDAGLGNNPHVIKALAKMGGTLTEDTIKNFVGNSGGALTRDEAQNKLNEVRRPGSPYWDKNHAEHSEYKRQSQLYYGMIFPGKQPKSTVGDE